MRSNKSMRIALAISSLLILLAVLMVEWVVFYRKDKDVIKVQLSQGETEIVDFESLSLIPGDSCEYVIKLKDDNFPKYDLSIKFSDSAPEKTLKNYAYVKVIADGKVVYEDLLATAFQDGGIVLPVDLIAGKNEELKIVYYLPLEVGNEAKNAEAIFKVKLTASNEE